MDKPEWVQEAEASRSEDETDENVDKTLHCPNATKLDRLLNAAMNGVDTKSGDPEELEVCHSPLHIRRY